MKNVFFAAFAFSAVGVQSRLDDYCELVRSLEFCYACLLASLGRSWREGWADGVDFRFGFEHLGALDLHMGRRHGHNAVAIRLEGLFLNHFDLDVFAKGIGKLAHVIFADIIWHV